MTKRLYNVLAALLVLACATPPWAVARTADRLDEWVGEYSFDEDGGRTAGGSVIYVVHQLTVEREGGALKARLESNGYQTYAASECEARVEAGRLKIFFLRHADENVFLRGDYKAGDHLLTLARSGRGRRARLLTYWGKFRPQFRRARQGRVYFEQVVRRQ
jgi:hypothetical protein